MRRSFIFIVLGLVVVLILGIIGFKLITRSPEEVVFFEPSEEEERTARRLAIGQSVQGRIIEAYTFKAKEEYDHLLFVGGIHGGYEWNSVLLAYETLDYLIANPDVIPNNLTVTIIPSANPDGVYEIIGATGRFRPEDVPAGDLSAGRFNANNVDLNRNFDCKWQPESKWRGQTVNAGSEPFSEPEARALRDLVITSQPSAVIFWHSQSNAVYASECEEGILPGTLALMQAYAEASDYPPISSFDHYEVTGDAEGWLASIGIPAITVELATHETIEWERNLAGLKAVFKQYR